MLNGPGALFLGKNYRKKIHPRKVQPKGCSDNAARKISVSNLTPNNSQTISRVVCTMRAWLKGMPVVDAYTQPGRHVNLSLVADF